MAEALVTIAALALSFLVGLWTGDGTLFVGVVLFSVPATAAAIAEYRHTK